MKTKLLAGAILSFTSLCATTVLHAQEYPSRSVRIVSAFPTGSGPDAAARVLAQALSRYWGQQVIVEPRPGGSGVIAAEAVKNSRPDGHDIFLTDDGQFTINPHLYRKMSVDVMRDFAPAAMFFRTDFFMVVGADSPIRTAKDLTAQAAAKPGSLSYGSPRIGSPSHLGGAEYEVLTGTKMIHSPFTDGSQFLVSLSTGVVDWGLLTIATAGPMVHSGKLRMVAVASDKRSPDAPSVPTVLEAGGPSNFEVASWVGLFARESTPPTTLDKINRDVARALKEPEMQAFLGKVGYQAAVATREEIAVRIRSESQRNGERVSRAGAKAE